MKKTWPLQEAKHRFSEVVRRATTEGPQFVNKHGKASVVIISAEEYQQQEESDGDFIDFFRSSPFNDPELEVDLDLKRERSPFRDLEL